MHQSQAKTEPSGSKSVRDVHQGGTAELAWGNLLCLVQVGPASSGGHTFRRAASQACTPADLAGGRFFSLWSASDGIQCARLSLPNSAGLQTGKPGPAWLSSGSKSRFLADRLRRHSTEKRWSHAAELVQLVRKSRDRGMHGYASWRGAIDFPCGIVNFDNGMQKSCRIGVLCVVLQQRLKFLIKNGQADLFGMDLKTLNRLTHLLHAFKTGGREIRFHLLPNSAQRQDDRTPPVLQFLVALAQGLLWDESLCVRAIQRKKQYTNVNASSFLERQAGRGHSWTGIELEREVPQWGVQKGVLLHKRCHARMEVTLLGGGPFGQMPVIIGMLHKRGDECGCRWRGGPTGMGYAYDLSRQ